LGKLSHNPLYIELFDQYIHHQLDESQRIDFENRLNTDSEFKKEFDLYCLLVDGIREKNRQDLKSFMKESKNGMYWGQNIWPRSVNYAAAAVLALFFVMYVLVKKYSPENQASEMAEQSVPNIDTSALPSIEELGTDTTQLAVNETNQIPIPPDVQTEDVLSRDKESIDPQESLDFDFGTPVSEAEKVYGYKLDDLEEKDAEVLSDKKLKDTIVYLTLLENRLDVSGNTYLFNSSTIKETTLEKRLSSTPSAKSEDVSNVTRQYKTKQKQGTVNETTTKKEETEVKDSVELNKGKDRDGIEDIKNSNNSKLKIELWSSPINFIGYSYTGNNSIKLYGMNKKNYKFYIYNQVIYMVYNSKVYTITYCATACEFIELKDETIKALILNQK
jgi:hypothetical protein